jgi:hypothetical protein
MLTEKYMRARFTVMANAILLSTFAFAGCTTFTGGYREIRLKRKIPIPYQTAPEKFLETSEILYLLQSKRAVAENRNLIDSAIGGGWRESLKGWLAMQSDCQIDNNAGVAAMILGDHDSALEHLTQALSECPDSGEIRLNYRALLYGGEFPDPVYAR